MLLKFFLLHTVLLNMNYFQFRSISPQDGTLTGTNTQDLHGPKSIGNKGVPHTHQIFRTGALPKDTVGSYPGHQSWGGGKGYSQCIQVLPKGWNYASINEFKQIQSKSEYPTDRGNEKYTRFKS